MCLDCLGSNNGFITVMTSDKTTNRTMAEEDCAVDFLIINTQRERQRR